jgi:hypothetical protein
MIGEKILVLADYQPPVMSVKSLTATFDIQKDHVMVEESTNPSNTKVKL